MIAFFLGLVGIAFALNGLMMLPNISTALHQQVAATYMVGGVVVFGLAVVAARTLSMVDHLGAIARAMTVDQAPLRDKGLVKAEVSTSSKAASSQLITCPNCGRQNPEAEVLCACGLNLKR